MKKILALLLCLTILFSLMACSSGEHKEDISGAASSEPTDPDQPHSHKWEAATCLRAKTCRTCKMKDGEPLGHCFDMATQRCSRCGAKDDRKYAGVSLEIYGMGTQDAYTDYSQFENNYMWMMRAAMQEWAEINGVNLVLKGAYDKNVILNDITSGGRPDIIFQSNKFSPIANTGLITQLTDKEYDKLADICGKEYLDAMTYNNKSAGVVLPWASTVVCYYNKTLFQNYGVKTPREYFDEGNWTWETFMQCMEEMTRDVDSDGMVDIYGLNGDSWNNLVNPWATDKDGRLISTIDEPWMQDFFQMKYDAFTVKKITIGGKSSVQASLWTPDTYPMYAMQLADCYIYDVADLYETLPNGNKLEVVPVPEWRGDNGEVLRTAKVTQSALHLAATCDQHVVATELLAYVLQCGLKYMSDMSLGAIECDYTGIQGTCELSAQWKSAFDQVCADRAAEVQGVINFDAEYGAKLNEYIAGCSKFVYAEYPKVTPLTNFNEIAKLPPASAIAEIRQKYQDMLDAYNNGA